MLLTERPGERIDPLTETLLLFGARAQHVRSVIVPALDAGQWVLSDRFTDATRVYQGYGRDVSSETIEWLANVAHPALEPDLTFYLDVSVQQALARIAGRERAGDELQFQLFDDPLDRFERERLGFFERIRAGYLEIAGRHDRIKLIDASGSMDEVSTAIEEELADFLKEFR